MIRVCIVCEGQTEVEFVKCCLAPHLLNHQAEAFPSLLRANSGRHRGGRVTVERLITFMSNQYHHADRITTLVDFYGFQDRAGKTRCELENEIKEGIVKKIKNHNSQYILPYIQMYEFEALLFSNPDGFEWVTDGWNEKTQQELHAIAAEFPNPENINDRPETAPSKRIANIFSKGSYSKVEHGPLIAEAIGIDAIRQICPLFDDWVSKLERWS